MREKESAPKSLKDYTNLAGKAKLTIKCQNTKILNHFDTFFVNKYEQYLRELREASNLIHINATDLSNSIKKFGKSLDSLSELFADSGFDSRIQFYDDLK